jgi:hypothetical protein
MHKGADLPLEGIALLCGSVRSMYVFVIGLIIICLISQAQPLTFGKVTLW